MYHNICCGVINGAMTQPPPWLWQTIDPKPINRHGAPLSPNAWHWHVLYGSLLFWNWQHQKMRIHTNWNIFAVLLLYTTLTAVFPRACTVMNKTMFIPLFPVRISTEHSPKLQIRSHSYLRAVSEVSINRSMDNLDPKTLLDPKSLLSSPQYRSRNESYMRAMSTISQVGCQHSLYSYLMCPSWKCIGLWFIYLSLRGPVDCFPMQNYIFWWTPLYHNYTP